MPSELENKQNLPKHVAIIMDGNGRWAKQQNQPRVFGHRQGVKTLKNIVSYAAKIGVNSLTVFAFSSENWSRPKSEVSFLMDLFMKSLETEVDELHTNHVCLRFIGDRSAFSKSLCKTIENSESKTKNNTGLTLNIAANYGGRWDIVNAVQQLLNSGKKDISETSIAKYLSLEDDGEVDILIRTGGEQRISNFLLWQSAYAELYFADVLWPDFTQEEFSKAIEWYQLRERRHGKISEQLGKESE